MPAPSIRIQTERLTLRPWRADDLAAFHQIWGDPEVIWWGANESLEVTRSAFERLLGRHADWPAGVRWYAIVERATGAIVGDVLLQPARFVEGIELGWHLCRAAWGRGLATEAARAAQEQAFREGAVERIHALVALRNERSLRVAAKLGLRPVREMEYEGLPHRLFAIDRPPG